MAGSDRARAAPGQVAGGVAAIPRRAPASSGEEQHRHPGRCRQGGVHGAGAVRTHAGPHVRVHARRSRLLRGHPVHLQAPQGAHRRLRQHPARRVKGFWSERTALDRADGDRRHTRVLAQGLEAGDSFGRNRHVFRHFRTMEIRHANPRPAGGGGAHFHHHRLADRYRRLQEEGARACAAADTERGPDPAALCLPDSGGGVLRHRPPDRSHRHHHLRRAADGAPDPARASEGLTGDRGSGKDERLHQLPAPVPGAASERAKRAAAGRQPGHHAVSGDGGHRGVHRCLGPGLPAAPQAAIPQARSIAGDRSGDRAPRGGARRPVASLGGKETRLLRQPAFPQTLPVSDSHGGHGGCRLGAGAVLSHSPQGAARPHHHLRQDLGRPGRLDRSQLVGRPHQFPLLPDHQRAGAAEGHPAVHALPLGAAPRRRSGTDPRGLLLSAADPRLSGLRRPRRMVGPRHDHRLHGDVRDLHLHRDRDSRGHLERAQRETGEDSVVLVRHLSDLSVVHLHSAGHHAVPGERPVRHHGGHRLRNHPRGALHGGGHPIHRARARGGGDHGRVQHPAAARAPAASGRHPPYHARGQPDHHVRILDGHHRGLRRHHRSRPADLQGPFRNQHRQGRGAGSVRLLHGPRGRPPGHPLGP